MSKIHGDPRNAYWLEHLEFNPKVSTSGPVVRGTGVPADAVVRDVIDGLSWEGVRAARGVDDDEIRACLVYSLENDLDPLAGVGGGGRPARLERDEDPPFCGVHEDGGLEIRTESGEAFGHDNACEITRPEHAVQFLRGKGYTKESVEAYISCHNAVLDRSVREALALGKSAQVRDFLEALTALIR